MDIKIDDKKLLEEMARQWVEICLMFIKFQLEKDKEIENGKKK
jgi:hypothetical protein